MHFAALWYNFDRYDENVEGGINHLGTAYDYHSLMHYDRTAFAINYNYPTISCRDPSYDYVIGTGKDPSETDLYRIRLLYGLIKE